MAGVWWYTGTALAAAAVIPGRPGRVASYAAQLGKRGVWLLDLHVGGRVTRWTSAQVPLAITDRAGKVWTYRPGLQNLSVRHDGRLEQQGVEVNSREIDWGLLAARGDSLEHQQGTLRYWYEGQRLESALEVLRGGVVEPEYGHPGQSGRLAVTLDATAFERFELYPPLQAQIDTVTFVNDRVTPGPLIDSAVVGLPFPVVWGYPGGGDDAESTPDPGTPAYLVDQDGTTSSKWVVCLGVVDAAQVHLWDSSDVSGITNSMAHADVAVSNGTDQLGQRFSYGSPVVGGGVLNIEGHRYYAGWNKGAGDGGGILYRGEVLRDLGTFVEWLLEKSGRDVDVERQTGESERLNRYKTDGFLNQRADLVAWFDSNLVPLFPIRRMRSAAGIWYRFVNWWATAADARWHLDTTDGQVTRASSLRTSRGQLANLFTFEYRRSAMTGHHRGRRILDADHQAHRIGEPDDLRIIGSPRCKLSQQRFGVLEAPVRSSPFVWSDKTAVRILDYLATRDALPRRFVSYEGPDLEYMEPGDVVLLTDPEVHLDGAVALVDAVHLRGQRLGRVDLEVLASSVRAVV